MGLGFWRGVVFGVWWVGFDACYGLVLVGCCCRRGGLVGLMVWVCVVFAVDLVVWVFGWLEGFLVGLI